MGTHLDEAASKPNPRILIPLGLISPWLLEKRGMLDLSFRLSVEVQRAQSCLDSNFVEVVVESIKRFIDLGEPIVLFHRQHYYEWRGRESDPPMSVVKKEIARLSGKECNCESCRTKNGEPSHFKRNPWQPE